MFFLLFLSFSGGGRWGRATDLFRRSKARAGYTRVGVCSLWQKYIFVTLFCSFGRVLFCLALSTYRRSVEFSPPGGLVLCACGTTAVCHGCLSFRDGGGAWMDGRPAFRCLLCSSASSICLSRGRGGGEARISEHGLFCVPLLIFVCVRAAARGCLFWCCAVPFCKRDDEKIFLLLLLCSPSWQ